MSLTDDIMGLSPGRQRSQWSQRRLAGVRPSSPGVGHFGSKDSASSAGLCKWFSARSGRRIRCSRPGLHDRQRPYRRDRVRRPLRPSQHTVRTSATPRFLISVSTVNQYFAPSRPWPAYNPNIRVRRQQRHRSPRRSACSPTWPSRISAPRPQTAHRKSSHPTHVERRITATRSGAPRRPLTRECPTNRMPPPTAGAWAGAPGSPWYRGTAVRWRCRRPVHAV